jgi:predicted AAA+ superfamily ATPase
MWITRHAEHTIKELLDLFPVVAILGARQTGKSSLVRRLTDSAPDCVIVDLERPSELRKLDDAELFFESNRERTLCLDEIQRRPDLFPLIRAEVDALRRPGRFIVLGSASPELLRQGSESLAGRIAFFELTPFKLGEVGMDGPAMRRLWVRGGFPDSYLARTERASMLWREHFMRTFVERDIPQHGFRIESTRLMRMLTLCAHQQGQPLNLSKMAQFLDVSGQTVRNHFDLLSGTFITRTLPAFAGNIKKRLVKAPKAYFRDQGLLHQLLGIDSFNELMGHPVQGASWEGFAIEQIISTRPDWNYSYYRTGHGAEIDLLIECKDRMMAVEFKSSKSPKVSRGFYNALDDLSIEEGWVVIPSEGSYASRRCQIAGLADFIRHIESAAR